jgi:tetratricopeptide (TPR) repeat protein
MSRPRRSLVRFVGCLVALGLGPDPAAAGLHYSGEQYAELPSRLRGFLIDQRALRSVAVERTGDLPASHLRDEYRAAAARLEKLKETRPLSADEAADLGAVLVRLGRTGSAVDLLVPAARRHPEHFRLAANLGTALQLAGDLERAAERLEEAVRLAPADLREAERWHLKLVRLRLREGRAANTPSAVDDLFGARYDGGPGQMTEADRQKLPADAVAIVQRLALWLPADARLLWQLAELANAFGDIRTAAAILDGCVTELALNSPQLRRRRQQLRAAADQLASKPELDPHQVLLRVKSSRPLVPTFDESTLPPIQADRPNPLPWPLLTATSTDARGRPTFPKHLERLDGKPVTLTGFMQPIRDELALTGFLLLEFPVGCWFCETPELNGLVSVELRPGRTADFQKSLVKVTGTLTLNRTDPEAYLFCLTDAVVGPVE